MKVKYYWSNNKKESFEEFSVPNIISSYIQTPIIAKLFANTFREDGYIRKTSNNMQIDIDFLKGAFSRNIYRERNEQYIEIKLSLLKNIIKDIADKLKWNNEMMINIMSRILSTVLHRTDNKLYHQDIIKLEELYFDYIEIIIIDSKWSKYPTRYEINVSENFNFPLIENNYVIPEGITKDEIDHLLNNYEVEVWYKILNFYLIGYLERQFSSQ